MRGTTSLRKYRMAVEQPQGAYTVLQKAPHQHVATDKHDDRAWVNRQGYGGHGSWGRVGMIYQQVDNAGSTPAASTILAFTPIDIAFPMGVDSTAFGSTLAKKAAPSYGGRVTVREGHPTQNRYPLCRHQLPASVRKRAGSAPEDTGIQTYSCLVTSDGKPPRVGWSGPCSHLTGDS